MSGRLRYLIQQRKCRAEHVDKKYDPERPDKRIRAPINRITEHPDKKIAPNKRNPEHPDKNELQTTIPGNSDKI